MTPNEQKPNKRARVAAALAGSILALGALGVAAGEQRSGTHLMSDDPTVEPVTTPTMTTGETVTETTAPPSPETSVATPEITTTPTSVEAGAG